MSSEGSFQEEKPVEVVFTQDVDESSEDPPQEEWSSLIFEMPEENIKRLKYAENLYSPGSGEICTKYIAQSASSVLRHPYYNYPGLRDPGVVEALLHPIPKVIYADDGQELYLVLCKEMGLCPVRKFYRELLDEKINLRYYGINPAGFRAIALSLRLNRIVKELDLTDNWIGEDGCFHLGEMLVDNGTLSSLNITGCRIGPEGARRLFNSLHLNRSLKILNLTKNQLGDQGMEYLNMAIFKGADVTQLNLCYNSITGKSIVSLAQALETNNKLTHLNLSWNSIITPSAVTALCRQLSDNPKFEEMNLSWNALGGIGNAMKILLTSPNLKKLILTNNKLEGGAIKAISNVLGKAKKLVTLDLSFNPLSDKDAMLLLARFKLKIVKLQNLIMDNVSVSMEFIETLNDIRKLNFRKTTVITYGNIVTKPIFTGGDRREIALNRAEAICKASKKNPKDIALIILELFKLSKEPMEQKPFTMACKSRGATLDDDLVMEILNIFPGPRAKKEGTIDMAALVDYVTRKWPDRKLPPTPPPEPEPEPPPKKNKKGKK